MINRTFIIFILITAVLSSCFKDNDEIMKLPPRQPGDPETYLMEQSAYGNQMYFNLESNELVAYNDIRDWDLAFGCSDTGYYVLVNPSTNELAAEMGYNFDTLVSPATIENWKWDKADGNPDSTALINWLDYSTDPPTPTEMVFYIDRGYSFDGTNLNHDRGYKKIILSIEDGKYKVRSRDITDMTGANEQIILVEKDPLYHFVHLNLTDGEVYTLEPPKDNWHLLFSQYTGKTPDQQGVYYDYFVRGVLLNREGISALVLDSALQANLKQDTSIVPCMDTSTFFRCISYFDVLELDYSTKLDTIGHLWKDVTVDTETNESFYECDTNLIHLIRTWDDKYFKLRFLDFYNADGIRGYISIEHQQL